MQLNLGVISKSFCNAAQCHPRLAQQNQPWPEMACPEVMFLRFVPNEVPAACGTAGLRSGQGVLAARELVISPEMNSVRMLDCSETRATCRFAAGARVRVLVKLFFL